MARRSSQPELSRRWTKDEVRTLTIAVGAFGIDYLVRKLGRSRASIDRKIFETFGGGVSRGTLSLLEVAESTGYNTEQLIRAGRALGQRWQRTSTHGRIMLSDDQREALTRWLAHDYWSMVTHSYACVDCGGTEAPHRRLGMCLPCSKRRWKEFARYGLRFSKPTLLQMVQAVRDQTPTNDRDWLDAFEASLHSNCVLTRSTLDRLLQRVIELGLGGKISEAREGARASS